MKQYDPRIPVIKGVQDKTASKNNDEVMPESSIGKRSEKQISNETGQKHFDYVHGITYIHGGIKVTGFNLDTLCTMTADFFGMLNVPAIHGAGKNRSPTAMRAFTMHNGI